MATPGLSPATARRNLSGQVKSSVALKLVNGGDGEVVHSDDSSATFVTATDHVMKNVGYRMSPVVHKKHPQDLASEHLHNKEVPLFVKSNKELGVPGNQEQLLMPDKNSPKTCIESPVDDSESCDVIHLSKPAEFVSVPCEVPDETLTCKSFFTHYKTPSESLYSGTQYTEAKDSFATVEVSDYASSIDKSSGSTKISESCDLESGKTSICRGSSASDVSDESSTSSFSSVVNKPHKGNDTRWDAIQAVRSQDGQLGLSHFRLLKKLGCGDIGSVYLSELCRTRSYFAMKVMDKAALESRKKLLRAQTEREILQCLDHPFLPTLYSHFETEKFSCLVMEFCPGGDLHALRQRQPGKRFSEHAARYIVIIFMLSYSS